jgi:hypothetical protein
MVRVGDVLRLERRQIDVDPTGNYREIGVRSFGNGIFHKPAVTGDQLGNKRVFKIEPGDLVLSNVFGWEGAVALAGETERGMIGSHRFMTYVPRDQRILTAWARWFFTSERGLELLGAASPGSAGRNRTLAIDRFERLEIPLPKLDEQRQVISRLQTLADCAGRLGMLLEQARTLSDAYAVSSCGRPDLLVEQKAATGWRHVRLGSIMTQPLDRVRVDTAETYPNVGIYSFGRGVFEKPPIDGASTSATSLNRVRVGQFIYSRLFAFEGAYAHVPAEFDGYFVSNEFPTFDVDQSQSDARWLAAFLRSPARWAELGGASKGLGVRRQRVPVDAVLDYELWLPPIDVQRSALKGLITIDRTNSARLKVEEHIDALVPAALNEAFSPLS